MAKKTLDYQLLHYGIRSADLPLIEQICKENGISIDWLKEDVLKVYNDQRTEKAQSKDAGLTEKDVMKILKKAIKF